MTHTVRLDRPGSSKNPVPGIDLAGVVTAVGSSVTRFRVGDEVYGVGKGSFAQFATARESKLSMKPSGLTFEQAAAVPVSGLTAHQGLIDVGRLRAGQQVLITGASGGVGTYAVQIAKAYGASVTGVCSTAKVGLVRSLGADHVIDYTCDDFADTDRRYDLILDIGGSASLARLRSVLTKRGTLVIAGGEGGGRLLGVGRQLRAVALSPFVRQRLKMFVAEDGPDQTAGAMRQTCWMQRIDPDLQADERTSLVEFLDYHRATFLNRIAGLDHEQLNRQLAPSALTLASLTKHLALVEDSWFHDTFLGVALPEPWSSAPFDEDPDWEHHSAAADQPADLAALYMAACDRSRAIVRAADSLDTLSVRTSQGDGRAFSLRWIMLHLIEETARHNGHADFLREAIDGVVGE